MQFKTHTTESRRSGFSLIELMVVIGLISLLITILVIAIGPSIENARIAATRATIEQIDSVIQARMDAISRMDVSVEAKKLAALNSSFNQKQAEFLIRKNLYRQALPQRPEDIYGFNQVEDTSAPDDDAPFSSGWTGVQVSNEDSDDTNGKEEISAAELFFYVLVNGAELQVLPNGKSYSVPTLSLDDINPNHISDTDNDGLYEFVDEWEQVLRFYNFPTQLVLDATNGPVLMSGSLGTTNQDPLDPSGLLIAPIETGDFDLTYAPSNVLMGCKQFNPDNYHDLNTYYLPLLMSAGPDRSLGIGEPNSTTTNFRLGGLETTLDEITDNITNRQQ